MQFLGPDRLTTGPFGSRVFLGIEITDTALYRNPYYHTPQDTPDRLDYDRLTRFTWAMQAVIGQLTRYLATRPCQKDCYHTFGGGMLQAWPGSDFRVRFGLSGVTPGNRDELTFRRVSSTARLRRLAHAR